MLVDFLICSTVLKELDERKNFWMSYLLFSAGRGFHSLCSNFVLCIDGFNNF